MSTTHSITEADILAQVIMPDRPDLSPDAARAIIGLRFGPEAIERMNHLAEKNRQGTLTPAEQADLDKYLRVGNFLNLIQAKARLSLAAPPEASS
jgi:hypothetical protein